MCARVAEKEQACALPDPGRLAGAVSHVRKWFFLEGCCQSLCADYRRSRPPPEAAVRQTSEPQAIYGKCLLTRLSECLMTGMFGFRRGRTGFAYTRGHRSRLPYGSGDLGARRFRVVLEPHHELLGKTPLGTIEGPEKVLAPTPLGMFGAECWK